MSFQPTFFQFLRDLAENSNRDWFQANKARYEAELRHPLHKFVESFADILEDISPRFICDKGSIFRIYRDTRFGADKTPYKKAAAIQFRHERGKDVHAPGFYLHLEPGSVFCGGGLWHPEPKDLAKVRDGIVAWPARWKEVLACGPLGGDSLTRPPRGFAADHPYIEDLKRKDFVMMTTLSEKAAGQPDFPELVASALRQTAPLTRFLCQALVLDY